MTTIIAPKKLIEVALPLDEINKASAREKSIRHGHPSTLHLWWARRPLAAARAVLFAQLVNDPAWKYDEAELAKPQIRSAITRKRNELFALIVELVQWENSNNQALLERAREEIRRSWRETCQANQDHPDAARLFDPKRLPPFHDPFAGGGSIPLEAQRLGLEAHASDLNPVAVLINKAMLEIPPKFAGRAPLGPLPHDQKQHKLAGSSDWPGASGLAEDVRRYGAWMRERALERIGHLYPTVTITPELTASRKDLKRYEGRALTVIAWLWARTVPSPNPAARGAQVPLVSSWLLSKKKGKESWVLPVLENGGYRFEVCSAANGDSMPKGVENGTKAGRAVFSCVLTNTPIPGEYIDNEASAGRMQQKLLAIVLEGERERIYVNATQAHESLAFEGARELLRPAMVPSEPCRGTFAGNAQGRIYGFRTFGDYFTARQLVALGTFSELVGEARAKARQDGLAALGLEETALESGHPELQSLEEGGRGAAAYADALAVYLAMGVSKLSDYNSALVSWSTSRGQARNTFGRQALPMMWDYCEVNPFASAAGDLHVSLSGISIGLAALPAGPSGKVRLHSALTDPLSNMRVWSTDPPYYDNVGYADLSDFFYVWQRRTLQTVLPSLYETILTPKAEELIAAPYRHGGRDRAEQFFLDGMTQALGVLASSSHPTIPATIYYAFKQSETDANDATASTGWDTFLEACASAGFAVVGTWPMRTERSGRTNEIGTNALASSIVLVCRPRPADAPTISRRAFLRELARELPRALREMTMDPLAAVAPVDLAQAAIGPGMAIFTRYAAVLEADGNAMPVRSALVTINKAIDDFFSEAEGELDADTRFCIGWFTQYGFGEGPFGEGDVLARAKGTSVEGVRDAGVLSAVKGKVRLLGIDEYPTPWDPGQDARLPVWEACHQLCRALRSAGELDAGLLLAKMSQLSDAIRQLAYRLYTLCERKGWAEQARPYNELVSSWPAILEQAARAPKTQRELFGD
ncbi:MAG: DUF1156 domain-containing protein [Myxococcota bacterium]|jgi:putative DNA methylase|nr:DUF1156 domain-containing protein [Myxococcota bacterium]